MPITLDGTNGITTPTYGGADTSEYLVPVTQFKNRIINGAMVIDQRNAGASVTPSNSYTLDRWFGGASQTSKYTVQQSSTVPVGFSSSLKVTSSSAYSVLAGDYFTVEQYIEGFNCLDLAWGTANAKTVTLSFQVYSSLTGTFGGTLYAGTGSLSYPFSYTISSANTWTSISVTIAGPTTGTWTIDNSKCIAVCFGLGVGSTYSGTAGSWQASVLRSATGATSVVGTNGATFYITGVQLEVGSTATSFDYRPYGTELGLCQRYYQSSTFGTTSYPSSTGYARAYASFPVIMRAAPTMTFTDLGSGGSSLDTGSYINGYYNTYQSLSNSAAGTFSWTATSEL